MKFNIFILCVFFLLGACLLKNSQIISASHIAKFTSHKSKSVYLIGVIDSDPTESEGKSQFILEAEKLKMDKHWQDTSGLVLTSVYDGRKLSYGERLLLEGKLYRPPTFKGFNYRDYLKRKHIYSILSVRKDKVVKKLGKNACLPTGKIGNPLKSFAFQIKHRMEDVIIKNLSPLSAGILNAIILGERQNLSPNVRDVLVKSGTVHVIAISGLHLGIVAFIALVILKTTRISRKSRYIFTIFLLIVYCILTGARTPVVRATVMAIILLFGYFLEREANVYNSLAIAALIILAVNPSQIFDISFQLSFLSVISIVWLTPKIKSIFPARVYKITWMRLIFLIFSVSAAAWLGLLPLIAYYFRIFSPVTVLANMIVVPYMTVIIASGFTLALIGMLIPSITSIFAASCELFIIILFKINSLLIAIPGAYFYLSKFHTSFIFLYYLLILLIFNYKNLKRLL